MRWNHNKTGLHHSATVRGKYQYCPPPTSIGLDLTWDDQRITSMRTYRTAKPQRIECLKIRVHAPLSKIFLSKSAAFMWHCMDFYHGVIMAGLPLSNIVTCSDNNVFLSMSVWSLSLWNHTRPVQPSKPRNLPLPFHRKPVVLTGTASRRWCLVSIGPGNQYTAVTFKIESLPTYTYMDIHTSTCVYMYILYIYPYLQCLYRERVILRYLGSST